MATSDTFDFNVTRDELLALAFQELNLLELGASLEPERLDWAKKRLNIILRRLDAEKQHIWTVSATPSTVTIVANTFTYTSSNGLPTNIKRLVAANYRNEFGDDTPLELYTPEVYSRIADKFEVGTPRGVLLSEHRDVGSQTLILIPTLGSVNTQSEVIGSDSSNYRCIRSHTSTTDTKPITGADYLLYWEAGGSSGSAWATDTDYDAPEHLRLWFERPLFDFDSSSDNPDVPQEWIEPLLFEMVEAISNSGHLSVDDRVFYERKNDRSRKKIFPSQRHHVNDKALYNKTKFF